MMEEYSINKMAAIELEYYTCMGLSIDEAKIKVEQNNEECTPVIIEPGTYSPTYHHDLQEQAFEVAQYIIQERRKQMEYMKQYIFLYNHPHLVKPICVDTTYNSKTNMQTVTYKHPYTRKINVEHVPMSTCSCFDTLCIREE